MKQLPRENALGAVTCDNAWHDLFGGGPSIKQGVVVCHQHFSSLNQ
jgi:hypothetical protein